MLTTMLPIFQKYTFYNCSIFWTLISQSISIFEHLWLRYNMEKFAGQPIDTLADSRRCENHHHHHHHHHHYHHHDCQLQLIRYTSIVVIIITIITVTVINMITISKYEQGSNPELKIFEAKKITRSKS